MTPVQSAARMTPFGARVLLAASLLIPLQASAQRSPVDALQGGVQRAPLNAARWLTGCWELAGTRGRKTVERWEAPRGGMMLGAAYAVTPAIVRENEQLRLYSIGDTLVYEAHPGNQARTLFRATRVTPNELVFENRANDFPQRITYRRVGRDSLAASIEGDRAGRRAPVAFGFARVACGRVGPSANLAARVALQAMYDDIAAAEQRGAGGRMQWLASQAAPGYRYVMWTEPGSDVQALDAAGVQLAASQEAAVARSTGSTARRYRATVERVRTYGDTAEVLVEGRLSHRLVDEAGRYGVPGRSVEHVTTERWIDTWMRSGGRWRLRATAVIQQVNQPGIVTRRNPE